MFLFLRLSGLSPFLGETDAETMNYVVNCSWDFDAEAFEQLSEDAKDFISRLLVKEKRYLRVWVWGQQHQWYSILTRQLFGLQPTMRNYYVTFLCASSGLAGRFLSDPETSVLKERFCVPWLSKVAFHSSINTGRTQEGFAVQESVSKAFASLSKNYFYCWFGISQALTEIAKMPLESHGG